MTDFDNVLNVAGEPNVRLLEDIKDFIVKAEAERPRSLQKTLGPSEAGHPCERQLAYKINNARSSSTEAKGYNTHKDPMAAILGTAAHAWMEEAAKTANKRIGRVRWITEQRVVVRPAAEGVEELAGSCDLYDVDTKTCIDWKFPGATAYSGYAKTGPSEQYRGQAHLYGQGYLNLGLPVESVAIMFISRTGSLRQMNLWREPYNQNLVDTILKRLDHVENLLDKYKVDEEPSNLLRIPTTSGNYCNYCNWWSPKPSGPYQCGGSEA